MGGPKSLKIRKLVENSRFIVYIHSWKNKNRRNLRFKGTLASDTSSFRCHGWVNGLYHTIGLVIRYFILCPKNRWRHPWLRNREIWISKNGLIYSRSREKGLNLIFAKPTNVPSPTQIKFIFCLFLFFHEWIYTINLEFSNLNRISIFTSSEIQSFTPGHHTITII